ncbi:hypothetical protein GLOIN_2v1779586 [Rhizophagus irregularis DAOM 181602=DAOM 197198]|uniref:RNase H type-1 domain-containing protein n=1 Tax=Rhizophagus irregularis (strain DAOM 181602 / DAOM 197198 / MUCL 43194) TaxID=747089 RepID=A0A2P4PPG1_RHIID|nr:hypothetical protein GLOIN_2v1779586 [Rhizophagus irregularis DAOM 181602=DAOM 197198]POG67266.1 hypothetical protein GLOIN_2v1779586 [Rhizophagus irregularis DAOM 181602=DAOM 197198]|eukprot:XP_025174132.1 hypothetical protein GLOIN_2v1779586 [Rhizophagus irregularis DAOM 181602=DAOM 197198]
MSEKYPNFISVSKNFLADQSFAIFVSLMHGSEACEHFFGMARQINSDFNYSELLQLVPKISQCTKALRTKNVTLEKEKSVRDVSKHAFSYHFNYNIGNINSSKLAELCAWPSDKDITSAVKHSYKLASELAKALDMEPTSNMNHSLLLPFPTLELENDSNEFFEIDREISDAISQASKHTTERIDDILDLSNIKNVDDQIQQTQVISSLDNMRIINNKQLIHDSSIRYIFPTEELNYLVMIKLRRNHEAYNSRPIERQNRTYMIGHENTNTINPNRASHIISHLTNNDDPARWKENWKAMTANLASLHKFELSRQRQTDKVTNKIICVESANITQDFPLQQSDYVIALYGTKICIAKIIAMYYEGYGNHCYSQNAVTPIEDLSYISLQVYLPIHLNIFASQTVKGYTLFTHQCPQNIIYHINLNGVIIGYSSLILTGVPSSTRAEIVAIFLALLTAPENSNVTIYIDSLGAINSINLAFNLTTRI